jgi:hypothetical protein
MGAFSCHSGGGGRGGLPVVEKAAPGASRLLFANWYCTPVSWLSQNKSTVYKFCDSTFCLHVHENDNYPIAGSHPVNTPPCKHTLLL